MRSPSIKPGPSGGLIVSTATYQRLQAFQGGGAFWDNQALLRRVLGEFLPSVEQQTEAGVLVGIFRCVFNGKEILANSRTARQVGIPPDQIHRLQSSLEQLKRLAQLESTEPNARALIDQFRLPDFSKDPDLYRVCGPWYDRRLQILWGCESRPDSSLHPVVATQALPVDSNYRAKVAFKKLSLILAALALLALLFLAWPYVKYFCAKLLNQPPIAAAKIDGLDLTNRVATVSDNGSSDPGGSIAFWQIAWGDGQLDHVTNTPVSLRHAYSKDGEYTISYVCTDNLGATSAPPFLLKATFDLEEQLTKQREAEAARKQAESIQKEKEDKERADAEEIQRRRDEEARKEAEKIQKGKDDEARAAAEAKQKAEDDAKAAKALEEAQKKEQEASTPPVQPPTATDAFPPSNLPNPNAPWDSDSKPKPNSSPKPNRPAADQNKGSEVLVQSLSAVEIQKSNVGTLDSNNVLEAILVVRDTQFPNAPLDVLSWEINGKVQNVRNAQYTVQLPIGTHKVRVNVIRATLKKTAAADVIISSQQIQSKETSLKVIPTR